MAYTLTGVEQYVSLGSATVSSGGTDAPAAGTSESWTLSASSLPGASSSAYTGFYVADPAHPTEVILVANISGSAATVTRGADGTTPVAHTNPFTIVQVGAGASLRALQWGQYVFNVVTQFGADPTGVAASDTAFADAIAARPADGCMIIVPPGTYSITSGVAWVLGASEISGIWFMPGCVINYSGTGDCFRLHSNQPSDSDLCQLKIYGCPVIDGTSAGAGSSGLHMGDIFRLTLEDGLIRNFTGSDSVGLWLDNTSAQTEQGKIRCYTQDCATGVKLDVNSGSTGSGTTSYDRTQLDLGITNSNDTFDGLVLNNGALLYEGKLFLAGNFGANNSTPLTSAVLRLTGDTSGAYSSIEECELHIGVESAAGTYQPYSVYFGAGSNIISRCYGSATFGFGGDTFQSSNNSGNWSGFNGQVYGDNNLPCYGPLGYTNLTAGTQTISGTTATLITDVNPPIAAYSAYQLKLQIVYTDAGSTGTRTFAWSTPAGFADACLDCKLYNGTTLTSHTTLTAAGNILSGVAANGGTNTLEIDGAVIIAGSGTLGVTGLISSGASDFTVLNGSYATITNIYES